MSVLLCEEHYNEKKKIKNKKPQTFSYGNAQYSYSMRHTHFYTEPECSAETALKIISTMNN
jgi:hypothetical protein